MKTTSDERIGVIGGGLGGLAAACTLAARGHKVILFERNEWLGGKAAVLEGGGFRFDMGPTIVTMPSVLRRIFAEAGRRLEDYLELVRLDPQWRCFFEDGSVLNLNQDPDTMAKTLDALRSRHEFRPALPRLHRASADGSTTYRSGFSSTNPSADCATCSISKPSFDPKCSATCSPCAWAARSPGTVRAFNPDPRVAQMIDHFTQYVGSSPYGSPAVLCGIAHMQTDEGVWYPIGGTRAVPVALEKLARELGVEIRTRTKVEKILTRGGGVTGVRTHGRRGDSRFAPSCRTAIPSARTANSSTAAWARSSKGGANTKPACSGVVLYLGLNRRYEHLAHHDFVFSRDPHEEFDWIYRKGEPAPDPTCYLAATTCTEPGTAPAGGEALYVLVHTPYLRPHHDWKKMLPAYRQVILEKLKRTGGMKDIEERIVFERALTPQDINDRYHVLNGAIYGLASHGRFLGAFKPGNRSPDLRGLYLAGGAAHPGPGMPMVLMSGWIAADALDRDGVAERGEHVMRHSDTATGGNGGGMNKLKVCDPFEHPNPDRS